MRKYLLVWLTLPWLLVDCSSRPVTEADLASHTFRYRFGDLPTKKVDNPDVQKIIDDANEKTKGFVEKMLPLYQFDAGGTGQGTNVPDVGMVTPLTWSVKNDTLTVEITMDGQQIARHLHIAKEGKGFILLETNPDGKTETNYLEPME